MTTTAATITLTDFLLARLAEDERTEIAHMQACRWRDGAGCTCGAVKRLKAEGEAKRAIVEEYDRCTATALADEAMGTAAAHTSQGLLYALCSLAAVYAGHPDYRDEWRP